MISSIDRRKSIEGMLFGIAVGDALGLAYEGLTRRQILRRLRRRLPATHFAKSWLRER